MPKLATDEQIIEAYKATGSVWKAAKRLGLCGQSVWERLRALDFKLPGSVWTDEENSELITLAGQCNLSEIARRLGRPYGSIASRLSALGISGRCASKKKISLRGTGFDKQSLKRLIKDLEAYEGKITQFARQRGFDIDLFIKAIQTFEPDFWESYSRTRSDLPGRECEYCSMTFYPMNKRQRTCSRKCQAAARNDRKYFNGNRRNTIGLAEGVCQLCERELKSLSSHHYWGKENDPDGTLLIALCNGCHHLVGMIASRKNAGDAGFYERLIIYANMRRNGEGKPMGYHCAVDIEELTTEEIENDVW